ncbi:MAG: sigma-70 family RNA polymerase sigma factor [Acidobacteria bacterium]|nr:sigma-70 family RNA polymerase sigma factor [Acidobacteriota bacterium]
MHRVVLRQLVNHAEFEVHYNRYSRYVHAILMTRMPPANVEDALQEVFMEAWRKLHELREDANFGPWVAAIARHKTADFFRRKRPLEPLLDVHAARSIEPDPILDALQKLPEAYRETLALRFIEGMTGPEIAEMTGLTHRSVRVNLNRGLALLREMLGVQIDVR